MANGHPGGGRGERGVVGERHGGGLSRECVRRCRGGARQREARCSSGSVHRWVGLHLVGAVDRGRRAAGASGLTARWPARVGVGQSPSPSAGMRLRASRRDEAPSLCRTADTWWSTVRTDTTSSLGDLGVGHAGADQPQDLHLTGCPGPWSGAAAGRRPRRRASAWSAQDRRARRGVGVQGRRRADAGPSSLTRSIRQPRDFTGYQIDPVAARTAEKPVEAAQFVAATGFGGGLPRRGSSTSVVSTIGEELTTWFRALPAASQLM